MRRIDSRIPRRMRKQAVQQGRSEVRDATKQKRHACGRARVGERPVSEGRLVLTPYGQPLRDARTPLADCFRILLDSPHDESSLCPMAMMPFLPRRKLVASRTARCFLPRNLRGSLTSRRVCHG